MQFSELREAPNTDESIAQILGYPTIVIAPEERGKECTNCGANDHTFEECKLPKMDELIEMFGPNICYDSAPKAVETKKKIIEDLYQPQEAET